VCCHFKLGKGQVAFVMPNKAMESLAAVELVTGVTQAETEVELVTEFTEAGDGVELVTAVTQAETEVELITEFTEAGVCWS